MNKKVLAIDCKTVNSDRSSICSIGVVLYKDGEIKLNKEVLINPQEQLAILNTKIHGIKRHTLESALKFPKVWEWVDKLIDEDTLVISHKASFDISVLRHSCDKYNMRYPNFEYLCTCKLGEIVYEELDFSFGIEEKIVVVEYDALSCLKKYKEILLNSDYDNIDDLLKSFNVQKGKLLNGGYIPFGVKKYKHRREINIDEVKSCTYDFENTHPFYKKSIVFTGSLESMRRLDAMKMVNSVGGIGSNSMSKNTNYLVVAMQSLRNQNKSSKLIMAERLINDGANIQIISEVEFLDNINT